MLLNHDLMSSIKYKGQGICMSSISKIPVHFLIIFEINLDKKVYTFGVFIFYMELLSEQTEFS